MEDSNESTDLSEEKEVELIKKIKEGKSARDELISGHQDLVKKIASWYFKKGTSLDLLDLIQEGNLGLIEAIDKGLEKFEIREENRFSAFAATWIKYAILGAIKNQEKEKAPSLQKPIGEEEEKTLEDLVSEKKEDFYPEQALFQNELKAEISHILDEVLSSREREIVKFRYGFEDKKFSSLEDIQEEWNLSPSRIYQIEKEAMEKLKKHPKLSQIYPDIFNLGGK